MELQKNLNPAPSKNESHQYCWNYLCDVLVAILASGEELLFVMLLAEKAVVFGVDGNVAEVEATGRAHKAGKEDLFITAGCNCLGLVVQVAKGRLLSWSGDS